MQSIEVLSGGETDKVFRDAEDPSVINNMGNSIFTVLHNNEAFRIELSSRRVYDECETTH